MAIVRSVFDRKRKYVESRQATRLQHELEDISIKLRKVQYATGCTTSTLNKVLLALAPHLKANVHRFKVQRGDNHMCAQSGATVKLKVYCAPWFSRNARLETASRS